MHSNLRHKLGHAYLIPSDNVIVLDWHFNLTIKISSHWHALIAIVDDSVVAYFGATLYIFARFDSIK